MDSPISSPAGNTTELRWEVYPWVSDDPLDVEETVVIHE